jgi:hypothetical protein
MFKHLLLQRHTYICSANLLTTKLAPYIGRESISHIVVIAGIMFELHEGWFDSRIAMAFSAFFVDLLYSF